MGFRDDFLADIDSIRAISGPDDMDIRTSQLTIRQRTWAGGRPGAADGAPHLYPATTPFPTAAVATDLPTALTLLANLVSTYSWHLYDSREHVMIDTVDTITAPTAVDLATALTQANQFKAQYNLHIASVNYHWATDVTNPIVAANATDLPSLLILINAALTAFTAHMLFDAVVDVDFTLARNYRIRQISSVEMASTGGRYEAGDIIVEHITPSDGMGNGYTIAQLKPRPTSIATEVIYIVTPSLDGDGLSGEYSLHEFRSWRPFTFDLVLRRTQRTP